MTVLINGHSFHYEMENLCRLFFHHQPIRVLENGEKGEDSILLFTGVSRTSSGGKIIVSLKTKFGTSVRIESFAKELFDREQEIERRMGVLVFDLLCNFCKIRPKWGILTGVRPVKLLRSLKEQHGEKEALDIFREKYLVTPEKVKLSRATMWNEQRILDRSQRNSFSLYISIPFCPTRCSYCSFVSSSVEKSMKLVPEYVEKLCEEIRYTGEIAALCGLRLESVYFGGGTPTTLSAEQLVLLLKTVRDSFDLSYSQEFTVEAGRPDTITKAKLTALRENGVTRISINPQTLNDSVLAEIGRKHSAAQTLEAFRLARECGMDNINMDLIAGLPTDTEESFRSTLDRILALSPESITVHTLSLKRSAKLYQEEDGSTPEDEGIAAASMLEYADTSLTTAGYIPYYLYRQSRMVGNLENTGWCKPGFESPYNVYIMDETHTILACGAGAATKVKDPYSDRLERIFNFKFPYEYISRFGEILARKKQVKDIYEEFRKHVPHI